MPPDRWDPGVFRGWGGEKVDGGAESEDPNP